MTTTIQTATEQARRSRSRRGWVFPILSGVLLVACASGLVIQQQSIAVVDQAQSAQILELERSITQESQAQQVAGQTAAALLAGAPSGDPDAVQSRIDEDHDKIEKLLNTMFTWDSNETYESARATLEKSYGVSADDPLLTSFMAPGPVSTDAKGNTYPYIDAAGLNSSLGSFTANPTSVTGTNYTYVVIASVQSSSSDGSATASRAVVLRFTTSPEAGAAGISDIDAASAPTSVRTSGEDHSG